MSGPASALRILLIEDEGVTVMQWRKSFLRMGHHVVGEAIEGQTGVRLASELAPDLVLMDYNMPGMDGLEATRQIMTQCPTAIMLASALSDDYMIDEAFSAGAIEYIVKPITSADLAWQIPVAMKKYGIRSDIEHLFLDDEMRVHLYSNFIRATAVLQVQHDLSTINALNLTDKIVRLNYLENYDKATGDILQLDRQMGDELSQGEDCILGVTESTPYKMAHGLLWKEMYPATPPPDQCKQLALLIARLMGKWQFSSVEVGKILSYHRKPKRGYLAIAHQAIELDNIVLSWERSKLWLHLL